MSSAIQGEIAALIEYALENGLIGPGDTAWARNRILEILDLDGDDQPDASPTTAPGATIDDLLRPLLDDAAEREIFSPDTTARRDLLDTAIMGSFLSPPSVINTRFWRDYEEQDPEAATTNFYEWNVASNYIRMPRIQKNKKWLHPTRYGALVMTINLAKPENDPRDIAASLGNRDTAYPLCMLCRENEGYAGRLDHPARQNLRLIGMDLAGDEWLLQYSPYLYYNEHCIFLSAQHRPMRIDRAAIARLLNLNEMFPHYFVGSNADLPIVGGSILTHDHFQGGRFSFPMDSAGILDGFTYRETQVEILDWPLSTVRLTGRSCPELLALADDLIESWRGYTDEAAEVFAFTGKTPHNTVTPICRTGPNETVQLDLVLRNNRTSTEHPDGIFHPHVEVHPVKKENIGLIEAMGLAVLPPRLNADIETMARCIADGTDLPAEQAHHQPMFDQIRGDVTLGDLDGALLKVRRAVGDLFTLGLEHCGVFGPDPAPGANRFLEHLGWR